MNLHGILTKSPSQYTSFDQVDNLALEISRSFRSRRSSGGLVLNIDSLLDWLELSLLCDDFEEPAGASFYAALDPQSQDVVQINNKYDDLFQERPDVYRHCIGHEIGHGVLRHLEHRELRSDTPLFPDQDGPKVLLHKSSWNQYGLTGAEVRERQANLERHKAAWIKQALINPAAREALKQLDDKFEPSWMFNQAEQFSRCITVPRDLLVAILEEVPLISGWPPIYKLAKQFGVSATTMKLRLLKLDFIEIDDSGHPAPKAATRQDSFFK